MHFRSLACQSGRAVVAAVVWIPARRPEEARRPDWTGRPVQKGPLLTDPLRPPAPPHHVYDVGPKARRPHGRRPGQVDDLDRGGGGGGGGAPLSREARLAGVAVAVTSC